MLDIGAYTGMIQVRSYLVTRQNRTERFPSTDRRRIAILTNGRFRERRLANRTTAMGALCCLRRTQSDRWQLPIRLRTFCSL